MFEEKIIPVCGDIMLPDLGISEHDRHRLEQEVHLVFHSAATVRFEETLRFEEKIPFGGTYGVGPKVCQSGATHIVLSDRLDGLNHIMRYMCSMICMERERAMICMEREREQGEGGERKRADLS